MRPLADRVLVIPDEVPETTASGLTVVDHWPAETSGTVAAVGRRVHPLAGAFHAACSALDGVKVRRDGAPLVARVCDLARALVAESSVSVGQRVVFTRTVGQELDIDGTRYFVLRETDLLGVME